MLRVFMIPVFIVLLMLAPVYEWTRYAAAGVFILACLTDLLDGKIARKYNMITDFGKFMDPLADKVLVNAAFVCLVELDMMPAWAVIVILTREFIISGFRLVASDNGIVIAASMWGKVKTVFHMLLVILLLLDLPTLCGLTWFTVVNTVVMYIAIILTIVSLVDYIWKNRQVLGETK
jgi:CDP-diacylglycerol--glycerol-3-phosphate 3-phosphatidyltransferase